MTDIAGKGFLQVYTHNLKVVGSNPTPATHVTCTPEVSFPSRQQVCFSENREIHRRPEYLLSRGPGQ